MLRLVFALSLLAPLHGCPSDAPPAEDATPTDGPSATPSDDVTPAEGPGAPATEPGGSPSATPPPAANEPDGLPPAATPPDAPPPDAPPPEGKEPEGPPPDPATNEPERPTPDPAVNEPKLPPPDPKANEPEKTVVPGVEPRAGAAKVALAPLPDPKANEPERPTPDPKANEPERPTPDPGAHEPGKSAAARGLPDAMASKKAWFPSHTITRLELAGSKSPYTAGGSPSVEGGWARTGDYLELRFIRDGKPGRVVCAWTESGRSVELLCGQEGVLGFTTTSYTNTTGDGTISLRLSGSAADVDGGVPTRIDVRKN